MRTTVKVVLSLGVAACFGAVAATTMAATLMWQACTKLEAKTGSFENSGCTKEKAEGEYEWLEAGESQTIRLTALSLRLEDAKGELGAAVRVKCNHASGGVGLVEGGNLLLIRETKVKEPSKECEAEGTGLFKACKTSSLEAVEGADLPWTDEVYTESSGKYKSRLSSAGAGEPGWTVKCAGVEDKCLSEAGKPEEISYENLVSAGVPLIFGRFNGSAPGDCSVGGKEEGHVGGFLAIEGSGGAGARLIVAKIVQAERTGGPGTLRLCTFTIIHESCTIEVKNLSTEEEEVRASEIDGGSKNNFGFKNNGCPVGTKLKPHPALGCTVEVWATVAGSWNSHYYVKVKQEISGKEEGESITVKIG